MRTQLHLDRELEELVGTERKAVDLTKASEQSGIGLLLHTMNKQLGELFEVFPEVQESFMKEGVKWYRKSVRKTPLHPSVMEFKSSE